MKNKFLTEAMNLFPDAESNIEALTRYENHVHQQIMSLSSEDIDEFDQLTAKLKSITKFKMNSRIEYFEKELAE